MAQGAPSVVGLKLGDVVRGRFCDGEWYLGTVERDNGDGTYTLAWLDGDVRDRVKALADLKLVRYCQKHQCYRDVEDQPGTRTEKAQPVMNHDNAGADKIEVLVRHPFTEAQVKVRVPHHAKFKHIKKALAQISSVPQRGELMRREGGRYRGYRDSAHVGDVREVLTTQSDLASGSVTLDDGEVSMDENTQSSRAGKDPSSSSCRAKRHLAPGSRVEILDGQQAGETGVVMEAPAKPDMVSVKLDASRTVHAVRTVDCLRVEEQAGSDSAAEIVKRLVRLKEEPDEKLSAAWEALQLEPGTAMAEIDRQFRRLSVRIHPDKCKLAHASDAFQVLVRAHDRLKGPRAGLARRARGAVEDRLTVESARELLEDLREAFTEERFSAKLQALEFQRDCYGSTAAFLRDRHELFTSVHATVLPRHGFEGSQTGVCKMLGQMGDLMEDEGLRQLATELNSRTGVELLPPRWGRVASACRKHAELEARPPPSLMGYHGLVLGGGGLLALAAPQRAAAAAPVAKEEPAPQLWPADKRPPFRLFVAGTWCDFMAEVMRWERGLFLHQVTVSAQGTERFHLLKNGSSEGRFYPDTEDASPFEGFTTLGPDSEGGGLNWQIGKHREEEIRPGSRVVIVVTLDAHGSLNTVDWQRGQLSQPSVAASGGAGSLPLEAAVSGGATMPDECLLPWETGEAPAWAAELDVIGA